MKETLLVISPTGGPRPVGPYSPALVSLDLVFVSGQVGRDPSTDQLVDGTIKEQTCQTLRNMEVLLRDAGCDFADVVKTTAFLARGDYFQAFNEVYAEFFRKPYPARSTIVCAFVNPDILVEIEAIARCSN